MDRPKWAQSDEFGEPETDSTDQSGVPAVGTILGLGAFRSIGHQVPAERPDFCRLLGQKQLQRETIILLLLSGRLLLAVG
jgi:hypothetical protein